MTHYGEKLKSIGGGCNAAYIWYHRSRNEEKALRAAETIHNALPHGSGINDSWHIAQLASKRNRFHCGNTYHAMTSGGMYCHSYNFFVSIDVLPNGQLEFQRLTMYDREHACCGYGLREYLEETIAGAIDEYNNQRG